MDGTVFVLGAGFSAPARLPVQAEIMRGVLERASQQRARRTIRNLFHVLTVEHMADVPLEDIFTILDRARNANETLSGFTRQDLDASYRGLMDAIVAEFGRRLAVLDPAPYLPFISSLLARRAAAPTDETPFAIVTLNWDTIVESVLRELSDSVRIDFGCDLLPARNAGSADAGAIPLFKLHGSLDWLLCTSCGRLFQGSQIDRSRCPTCDGSELETLIVTPTLVKRLTITHLSNIWFRASLALQDARRIVFVGYSLPTADFEFRYLLLRSIIGRTAVSVRVVLYPPDADTADARQRLLRDDTEARYRSLFGTRDLEFAFMDARELMSSPMRMWDW